MIELIGIIGGGLFAAGCVPMAYKTWKQGSDLGTPLETQWLLFLACILYSWFLIAAFGPDHAAFWFLVAEVGSWGVALWYHYFPRPCKHDNAHGLPAGYAGCSECGALLPDDLDKKMHKRRVQVQTGFTEIPTDNFIISETCGLVNRNGPGEH